MLPVGASVLGCTQSHWCECEASSQRAASGRTVSRAADSDLRQASPDSYNGCATVGRGDASTCGYKRQPELPTPSSAPLQRCITAAQSHATRALPIPRAELQRSRTTSGSSSVLECAGRLNDGDGSELGAHGADGVGEAGSPCGLTAATTVNSGHATGGVQWRRLHLLRHGFQRSATTANLSMHATNPEGETTSSAVAARPPRSRLHMKV